MCVSEATLKDAAVKDRPGSSEMVEMTHSIDCAFGAKCERCDDLLFFGRAETVVACAPIVGCL